MPDDSAYRKILRLMGRGRDSPNNKNLEPEYEYRSVAEYIRGKTFEFPAVSKSLSEKDSRLERKDEYLIDNGANLFKELVKYTRGKNNSFTIFSLKELQKATNNFSADPILKDSFRRTYRGIIEDRHVAVKILYGFLINEVISLSLIKHTNVVKLLGCCLETYFLILVLELPPNGTLGQYIFPEKLNIPPPVEVSWTDRLRIATEIADALSYLHWELNMTHRSLGDPQAVLLDEFHSAKLGAFDNSWIQNQVESSDVETDISNDVYHFGNILLNLLGIQRDIRTYYFTKCYDKVEILKYLKLNVSEKEMPQIEVYIDLLLRCQSSNKVAKRVEDGEDKVPSMEEVARELRHIRSMINPQPTADENQSDNLLSGANASTSYQEAKSDY